MKPLLTRIDEELAVCADPYRRAELLGERGCYLARIGDFASARQLVAEIRSNLDVSTRERVAVRVMLLEGLLLFFDGLDVRCRDRIDRAHAIGNLSGHRDLARLTAAWLAHVDLNLDRFDDVAQMVRYALRPPIDIADPAAVRARLVLANLSMLAGRVDIAKESYHLAWRGAVASGDDSAIAATFYNRASFLLNLRRIEEVIGGNREASQRFLELEVRSVDLYHRASRQTSLAHLLDLLSAMTLLGSGQFAAAASKYRSVLSSGVALNIGADDTIPAMELVLCLLELNRTDEARGVIESIEKVSAGRRLFDDELIIAGLKHRIGEQFGILINVDLNGSTLDESIQRFRDRQAELRLRLEGIQLDIMLD